MMTETICKPLFTPDITLPVSRCPHILLPSVLWGFLRRGMDPHRVPLMQHLSKDPTVISPDSEAWHSVSPMLIISWVLCS